MKKQQVVKWVSDSGREFDNPRSCALYEFESAMDAVICQGGLRHYEDVDTVLRTHSKLILRHMVLIGLVTEDAIDDLRAEMDIIRGERDG